MAKYNIYAVGYGIDPETNTPVYGVKCRTWDECKNYINCVIGAKYKGFLTDQEADTWIEKVRKEMVGQAIENALEETESEFDKEFVNTCKKLHVTPFEMSLHLQKQFVEQCKFIGIK